MFSGPTGLPNIFWKCFSFKSVFLVKDAESISYSKIPEYLMTCADRFEAFVTNTANFLKVDTVYNNCNNM